MNKITTFQFSLIIIAIIVGSSFIIAGCSSNESDLVYNKGEKFEEIVKPKILWRIVLLSTEGELVKKWVVKKEPEWSGGDDGLRCSFSEPITGKTMVSKYTFIEPYYDTIPKDSSAYL